MFHQLSQYSSNSSNFFLIPADKEAGQLKKITLERINAFEMKCY